MFKKLSLLCLSAMFAVVLYAQNNSEKAVADAVEYLRVAMVEGDSLKLDKIAAEKLLYGHSSGVVQDKPAFIQAIVSGANDFQEIELTDQTINLSDDAAVVKHIFTGTMKDLSGRVSPIKLQILTVWQNQKGQWKLLARQAVRPAQ